MTESGFRFLGSTNREIVIMYFWCFYTDQDGNELIIRLLVLQRMEMALSNVLLVFLWMGLGIINDLLVFLMNGGDGGSDGGGDK